MTNLGSDRVMAKLLSVGAALTTILIISGSVTDPVNVPKLVSLAILGFAGFALLMSGGIREVFRNHSIIFTVVGLFIALMTISVSFSNSPLSQNLYGSYGRNNGYVTYLSLCLVLLSALSINSQKGFSVLNLGLIFSSAVNLIYCSWVVVFGDFIGWSNPYGNILGTLGNPNFIGSFLGISFGAFLAFGINSKSSKWYRFSLPLILMITGFLIYKSHAIQGIVVGSFGSLLIGLLYVRSRFGRFALASFTIGSIVAGVFALLGALQIGPLTQYIYKTSVSLRGQYWLAGWNTGQSHPFTGVGLDAFGDWYRRARDPHALELPGVNTVVNAAHNVPLDIFAFGGWPLFLCYLLIVASAGVSAFKVILRSKDFDSKFAVLLSSWAGYQLQSIISINQIGLAVWGWLLSGALIAYERTSREAAKITPVESKNLQRVQNSKTQNPKFVLFTFSGALIGLLFALPPLTADAKWRSAQLSQSLPPLEESMRSSYFNPQNSMKYVMNIQTLESSNLFELSHKYALQATRWNPESFDLWKVLYLVKNSTPEEKSIALENMKRLDPLNPDVTATK
jgi:hypothetical protein